MIKPKGDIIFDSLVIRRLKRKEQNFEKFILNALNNAQSYIAACFDGQ